MKKEHPKTLTTIEQIKEFADKLPTEEERDAFWADIRREVDKEIKRREKEMRLRRN